MGYALSLEVEYTLLSMELRGSVANARLQESQVSSQ